MQETSWGIWTRVTDSISQQNNTYAKLAYVGTLEYDLTHVN